MDDTYTTSDTAQFTPPQLTAEQCAELIVNGLVTWGRTDGRVYVRGGIAGGMFTVAPGNGDQERAFRIAKQVRDELKRIVGKTLASLRETWGAAA